MLVTLEGISMDVKPLQAENAPSPMLVTLEGITVFLQPTIKAFDAVSIIALQLSRLSYFVLPEATIIDVRPLQYPNAHSPMLVTLEGISMDVKPLQTENAPSPMLVTLEGITVFLQPTIKAFDAVSIIALQLSRLSYFVLPEATIIDVRPLQYPNAHSPMLVTLEGISMDVRPIQPENALSPMLVTLYTTSLYVTEEGITTSPE